MERDLYEVLSIDRNATPAEIKKAYRNLARKFHPDQNPDDPTAQEKFKEVGAAYAVLSDEERRAQYDRYGADAFRSTASGGGGGGGFGGFNPGAAGFTDINDLLDMLGSMFGGGGGGGRSRSQRGRDFIVDLGVTFEEAATGTSKEVEVPTIDDCETCGGNGAAEGATVDRCGTCGGAGQVRVQQGFFVSVRACPKCNGRGESPSEPCQSCTGIGVVQSTKSLEVDVPAGVDSGQKLKWEGGGAPGSGNGPRGDLLVNVILESHSLFERDGKDVLCTVPISFTQAALGARVDVPTLDGKVVMTVPAGTQSSKVMRLRKKGFPSLGNTRRGDQLVSIIVETPVKLNGRQRELYEELAQLSDEQVQPEQRGFFNRMKDLFG